MGSQTFTSISQGTTVELSRAELLQEWGYHHIFDLGFWLTKAHAHARARFYLHASRFGNWTHLHLAFPLRH